MPNIDVNAKPTYKDLREYVRQLDAMTPEQARAESHKTLAHIEILLRALESENPTRKIGRNDPCPCGSGKKFKKCHLGVVVPDVVSPEPVADKITIIELPAPPAPPVPATSAEAVG